MMERLATHQNLTFSERELLRYLKTVNRFTRIDEEILATITFKHSYQRYIIRSGLFISFPYKESGEKELNKIGTTPPELIGNLIKQYIEENTPIDSILINKRVKATFQKPLQIKLFGKPQDEDESSGNIITFLEKYSTYAPTDVSLILFSQKTLGRDPSEVADWLKQTKFPFKEVVFIEYYGSPDKVTLYNLSLVS